MHILEAVKPSLQAGVGIFGLVVESVRVGVLAEQHVLYLSAVVVRNAVLHLGVEQIILPVDLDVVPGMPLPADGSAVHIGFQADAAGHHHKGGGVVIANANTAFQYIVR